MVYDAIAQPVSPRKMNRVQPEYSSLGGGLLQERFRRNRDRVAGLPNDGLLKRYRERAGLPAPGSYLSTWDEGRGICGAGGEFLGHWLSAASHICAWTRDTELRSKLDDVLNELKQCADHDGYVSTAVEADFQRYTHNFYRFDKLLGGLVDAYQLTGDGRVLHMAVGTANRFQTYLDTLTPDQVAERLTDVWKDEAYGAIENLVRLYEMTGQARYLDFARKLEIRSLRDDLAADRDVIKRLHSYSHDLLFMGYTRMYEATGDVAYLAAASNAWEMINRRTYVTGGSGDGCTPKDYGGEAWRGPYETPLNHQTQETCESYAWIKHCAYLLWHTGDVKYADMLERTLYNHILPSQGPGRGDWAYWLPLQDRAHMIFGYCWNDPNFLLDDRLCGQYYCCDGTGTRALAELPRWIFFSDSQGLIVNLYTSAEACWAEGGTPVTVSMTTAYPWSGEVQFVVKVQRPTRMNLRLRIPGWVAQQPRLEVNGVGPGILLSPGSFASLDRQWQDGDRVRLDLPMSLRSERLKSDAGRVALLYGPLVLAGLLSPDSDLHLPGDPANPSAWLAEVPGEPATFLAPERRLHFRPLFTVASEPYNVYFLLPPP